MRWIASLVAEVHRILMRGGLFMYPNDTKDPAKPRTAAPPLRSQSDGDADRAGGRHGVDRPRSHPRDRSRGAAPARARHPRLRARGRADRPLSRGVRPRRCRVHLAAVQRAVAVRRRRLSPTDRARNHHVEATSRRRDHRLVRRGHDDRHPHLRAHLPARGHHRGDRRGRFVPSLRPQGDEGEDGGSRRGGQRAFQPLRPRGQSARGTRGAVPHLRARAAPARSRKYLHDAHEAAPYKQDPGTFTPWADIAPGTDLLFYEGLHGAAGTDEVEHRARMPTS